MATLRGGESVKLLYLPTENLKDDRQQRGLLASGKFRGTEEERIDWVSRKLLKAIDLANPDLVVIEGYAFSKFSRSLSGLHEMAGVVKYRLRKTGRPYVLVGPQVNKKYATGNGKASKIDMIAAAKEIDPLVWNDDVADALCLAKYGHDLYKKIVIAA